MDILELCPGITIDGVACAMDHVVGLLDNIYSVLTISIVSNDDLDQPAKNFYRGDTAAHRLHGHQHQCACHQQVH